MTEPQTCDLFVIGGGINGAGIARDAAGRGLSVIMIDCDLYTSAKQALDFCAPLIKREAVVFFDDWTLGAGDGDRELGEQRAFAEWLSENPSLRAEEIGTYYQTQMEPPEPSKVFLVGRSGPGGDA